MGWGCFPLHLWAGDDFSLHLWAGDDFPCTCGLGMHRLRLSGGLLLVLAPLLSQELIEPGRLTGGMTNFSFGNFAAVMNVGQHVCLPRRHGSCLVVLINKCFLSFILYVCLRSPNWRMTNFSFGNFAAVMNVGQHVCLPRAVVAV